MYAGCSVRSPKDARVPRPRCIARVCPACPGGEPAQQDLWGEHRRLVRKRYITTGNVHNLTRSQARVGALDASCWFVIESAVRRIQLIPKNNRMGGDGRSDMLRLLTVHWIGMVRVAYAELVHAPNASRLRRSYTRAYPNTANAEFAKHWCVLHPFW